MSVLPARLFAGALLAFSVVSTALGGEPEMVREPGQDADPLPLQFLDLRPSRSLDHLLPRLSKKRVIYIGERHDHYAHHLAQLQLIRGLYRQNPDMAIGMEMFQRPYQKVLDDYVSGAIGERQMLKQSQWFSRWQFDYRLYRPILRFARQKGIPLVALNLSSERVEQISRLGLDGLPKAERAGLPQQIDRSDEAYRARLKKTFEQHPHRDGQDFSRFLDVQLSWDETMAETAANYLVSNPRRRLVVLAGDGHLLYGSGIPRRVQRRIAVESAILIPEAGRLDPGAADFLILAGHRELPPRGLLGIYMESAEGGVRVAGLVEQGAAAGADIEKGDLLLEIDGQPVAGMEDVQLALLGRRPGDLVQLRLSRPRLFLGAVEKRVQLALGR